ncbi:T9SS type A sorting domain-containing protein, partial [bacterium]|nr:T9SS type A sorting domain-containing protein [bacterium]
ICRSWPVNVARGHDGGFTARDETAPAGEVAYRLSLYDGQAWSVVAQTSVQVSPPAAAALGEPYPNPFNPSVKIAYALPRPGPVRLTVHDARGRVLATLVDGVKAAGTHEAAWEGRDKTGKHVPSGTYFIHLETDDESSVRKTTLLR